MNNIIAGIRFQFYALTRLSYIHEIQKLSILKVRGLFGNYMQLATCTYFSLKRGETLKRTCKFFISQKCCLVMPNNVAFIK